ncbi:haloacid dehalogenase [Oceanobacillus oncorhynchi subsp. oncorhynchi]|uniref:HAD family hydrolase n=1 Tax=Oceanobacillus oncorhynchi TaxID=545501 RepID=UPI0031D24F65
MANKHYNQVREFHKAFNYKQADEPTPISTDVVVKRTNYLLEEIVELLFASSGGEEVLFDALVDNLIENVYKEKEAVIKKSPDVSDKLVAQLDALTDISYFNYGNFAIAGVEPENLFDVVHESNMSKLDPETGKPIYREDGKVLKGDGFIEPEPKLKEEIELQKKRSSNPSGKM